MRRFPGRSTVLATTLLAVAAALHAQESITIRGIVIDSATGNPVAGAYVGVRDSRHGAGTNTSGAFELSGVKPGAIIEVRQLGYATYIEQVHSSATLRIPLTVNPIVMDRIEVVTDRLAERWRASAVASRRYTADQVMAAHARNARDFVQMRASLSACPTGFGDCVWRRGRRVPVTIYVDDIPYCSDTYVLESIPTHEIHQLEIVGGSSIYVYTKHFAERLAIGSVQLMPRLLISSISCR